MRIILALDDPGKYIVIFALEFYKLPHCNSMLMPRTWSQVLEN
jgi:hypothetical protein